MPTIAPFGTWKSPISAELIAKIGISFDELLVDPVTSAVYHVEKRPSEAGRNVVVDAASGKDVFGREWNARTGVQEYGGASAVVHDGIVYFSHFSDGRVYRVRRGGDPVPVTPENKYHRFANFAVHPLAPNLLVAVLEDHTRPTPADVETSLVILDTRVKSVHPLFTGADFYAAPAFSPDGGRLAWIQWRHPDMPWEGAEVHVAEVEFDAAQELAVRNERKVKGAWKTESAVQPHWISPSTLLFSSDESGYQNPWIVDLASPDPPCPLLATPLAQDFAEPGWRLGDSYSALLLKSTVLCTALREGHSVLYLVDIVQRTHTELATPYVHITHIRRTGIRSAVFLAEAIDAPKAIVAITLDESGGAATFSTLRGGDSNPPDFGDERIDKALFAVPRPITFSVRGGEPLHVVFYAPTNPAYNGPSGEQPPCIVSVHGGPTGMAGQGLNMRQQYFTSRGFAWVDVNYGGSSGFGRNERLVGNWGVTDVQDCVDAVHALAAPSFGEIDPARVLITGSSAGGYTVLQALCVASDAFAAGTASYGVSNLFTLMEDTHKFESRYMEKLVGGTPETVPDVYRTRSPVFHAAQITAPLLILQGSIDTIVPPSQAEEMIKVIRANGGRVECKMFEGEAHGWRKVENIVTALETELDFYLDVLGLKTRAGL